MDKNSDQIESIKKRIEDLRHIMNSDMGASFKEAVQTEEMIKILEIQLRQLLHEKTSSTSGALENSIFNLKSKQGKIITVTITTSSPDPSKNIFSANSPIGQKLLQQKSGEKITLRNEEYELI